VVQTDKQEGITGHKKAAGIPTAFIFFSQRAEVLY